MRDEAEHQRFEEEREFFLPEARKESAAVEEGAPFLHFMSSPLLPTPNLLYSSHIKIPPLFPFLRLTFSPSGGRDARRAPGRICPRPQLVPIGLPGLGPSLWGWGAASDPTAKGGGEL